MCEAFRSHGSRVAAFKIPQCSSCMHLQQKPLIYRVLTFPPTHIMGPLRDLTRRRLRLRPAASLECTPICNHSHAVIRQHDGRTRRRPVVSTSRNSAKDLPKSQSRSSGAVWSAAQGTILRVRLNTAPVSGGICGSWLGPMSWGAGWLAGVWRFVCTEPRCRVR